MATGEIKGSAFTAATDPTGMDLLGVQGGVSKKINRDVLVGAKQISYTAGDGVNYRMLGTAYDAATPNFNFGVHTFAGVNLPNSSKPNSVFSMGWNTASNGAREDTTKASLRIAFEEHYLQGGTGVPAFEWHLSCFDTAGVEHRPITTYLHKDGSFGSDMLLQVDRLVFNTYNGAGKIDFNWANSRIDLLDSALVMQSNGNNVQWLRQLNAAGNAYLPLPYYGADNAITVQAAVRMAGATPTTGTYPNIFAVYQPTTLAANGSVINIVGPSVTGNAFPINAAGECTGDFTAAIYNNANTANSRAVIELRTIGATAGDPVILYHVNGGNQWAVGLDNSDSDSFKWGLISLGSNDRMILDTTGNLSLPVAGTGFRVKEGSNAKQGVATLVGGTVTVANTSVTANSRIMLTSQSDGGTPGFLRVSARTAGTSFTITSSSGADTSVVAYQIFEPA